MDLDLKETNSKQSRARIHPEGDGQRGYTSPHPEHLTERVPHVSHRGRSARETLDRPRPVPPRVTPALPALDLPAASPEPAAVPTSPASWRPRRRGLSFWSAFAIAVDSLLRNKTRSVLAMLGIIIGVASVITMMALAEGTRLQVEASIRKMGTNTLMVRAAEIRRGGVAQGAESGLSLKLEDVAEIVRQCPAVSHASPRVGGSAQVKFGNKNSRTDVMGVTSDFFTIRNMPVASGRAFRSTEIASRARVCVLGSSLADTLFGNLHPLGKRVAVRGQPFEVVGVLAARGGSDSDWDERIWIPVTTAMTRMFGLKYISRIDVQARDEASMAAAQEQIDALLTRTTGVREGQEKGFEIRNQLDLLETANESNQVLTMLLAGIAGVSLLVGGIGIMNIMLVSVVERTREIGIRRALGAYRSDIVAQFVIESLVMCSVGAGLGVLGGMLACWVGATWASWPIQITLSSIALSSGCAVGIGFFFGLYPAVRAAGLSPLQALRHE